MYKKEHKQSNNHVIIVTSDAEDANVKQYRLNKRLVQILVITLCVVIGAVIGYFINEDKIREIANRKTEEQKQIVLEKETIIAGLNEEITLRDTRIKELEVMIDNLNDKIEILSETVNQKTEHENSLQARLDEQALPTEYPLKGPATMQERKEGDPICIFTASEGITVVATASGTVIAINEDSEYEHNVWIDHGNGYITVYRNKGTVNVKLGDTVAKGTTIFMIGSDNTAFGYQIMKDQVYIDPMSMLKISG